MKKQFSTLLLLTTLSLLLFNCTKKEDDPTPEADFISISSVTPSTGLVDGVSTSFEVVVKYKLASKDAGELNIGFNSQTANSSTIIIPASKLVTKGTGTYTFNVDATPKDWGTKPFHAYVNLSEYPHSMIWIPLAAAKKNLSF
jgi:hypothetical protein